MLRCMWVRLLFFESKANLLLTALLNKCSFKRTWPRTLIMTNKYPWQSCDYRKSLDNWEICMIKIWIIEVRQYYSFKVNHSIVFNNNLDANLKTRWKHQYCFKTMSKVHLIIAYCTCNNLLELNLYNKIYKVQTLCILNTFIPFVKFWRFTKQPHELCCSQE